MPFALHIHLSTKDKRQGVTLVDRLMSAAAVVHPLTALPQVYQIYSTHNVSGVSVWTWLGFMLLGAIFLAYGIVHKIKPFIVTQVLWFTIDFLIVFGTLLYR
jgi:uncharacterized protein with PQ loop repeat